MVIKPPAFKRQETMAAIKHYFYGFKNEYSPFMVICSFNDLHIRRIGEGPLAPSSALPMGATRKVDETRIVKVELSRGPGINQPAAPNTVIVAASTLLHQVMGISMAEAGEEAAILQSNILGYVCV